MDIKGIIKTAKGTKVYKITNGKIEPYEVLGFGRNDEYFFFASLSSYTDAMGVYIKTNRMEWAIDYNDAKEIMWNQLVSRLDSINETYFDNTKRLDFEL